MATLTRAHQELFRRTPDECFPSFDSLYKKCADDHIASDDLWSRPQDVEISGMSVIRALVPYTWSPAPVRVMIENIGQPVDLATLPRHHIG